MRESKERTRVRIYYILLLLSHLEKQACSTTRGQRDTHDTHTRPTHIRRVGGRCALSVYTLHSASAKFICSGTLSTLSDHSTLTEGSRYKLARTRMMLTDD